MELPQEIEIWYVIPMIRKKLVYCLKQEGLKQNEIAKIMGVTESAVSQYVQNKRAKKECFGDRTTKEIEKSAKKIIESDYYKSKNFKEVEKICFSEINRICKLVKKNKVLCKIHKSKNDSIGECNLCFSGD